MKDLNVSKLREHIRNSRKVNANYVLEQSYNDNFRNYKVVVSYLKFPKEKATINLKLVTEDITTHKNYNLSDIKLAVEEINRFYKSGEIN